MTFIIHLKDGPTVRYTNSYHDDTAWDDVYMTFPGIDYVSPIENSLESTQISRTITCP
jgi:hypothetical protein